MKTIPLFALLILLAGCGPDIRTRSVEYRIGDTVFEGYMAWDASRAGVRPGVLVVHEWYGLNDYARMRARQLAELGYVALAADMYGGGKVAADRNEASRLASALRDDRGQMRRRARAALAALRVDKKVDAERLAAIGYCFGGGVVLELARSGADVDAVASFHGNLDTPDASDAGNIRGTVLVQTGAADPHVPDEQVAAFEKEMTDADVDWYLIVYGNAVHSFTNPGAGDNPSTGSAYNEKAARRSWAAMRDLFDEVLR